ncbi:hypothetical protein [Moheibacter lacus]|uniref:Uncharacterized protein n=1 Tax=Moheibacter lacus TaxID=2745851 RepID=A0A838ZN28_9FLAO|nr:hypothetical protein [Moheibacter lacus]MBA5629280.1 hypothetical protein [Moheibacter lacus]
MQSLELKNLIHTYIENADDKLLNIIKSIFESYQRVEDEAIIGHTADGRPLTKSLLVKRIKKAEKDIDEGRFTSHEELLEEMKNW